MSTTKINRKSFLGLLGWGLVAMHVPLQACKQRLQPKATEWTEQELSTLNKVLLHLWPAHQNAPSVEICNSLEYLQNVLKDKYLHSLVRKALRNGPHWVEEIAEKKFSLPFQELNSDDKEEVLRHLETKSSGKRFLKNIIRYHFEALLGDPEYSINKEKSGWKWLNHVPGYPRPTQSQIYIHNE